MAQIRAHLRHIDGAFARGEFQIPGFVHVHTFLAFQRSDHRAPGEEHHR